MQISVSLGSTVRPVTVAGDDISNVKHSVPSVIESYLMGIDTHWKGASSVIVTSPVRAV